MFAPDVVILRQFYATPLGAEVMAYVGGAIKGFWPDAAGDTVLGIGYTTPYLEQYRKDGAPVFIAMPAQQGAAYWPPAGANRVFLSHESELPLAENSVNRVLLLHSVENSEQLSWMMREIWRVLTPGGRILAVVPNRMGMWSRSSRSPFGYGRPFNMMQLKDLLADQQFTLTGSGSALFMPPTRLRICWRMAKHIEWLGKIFFRFIGGVLLIEAEKQVYAAIRQPVAARQAARGPMPATQPAMSSISTRT